MMYRLPDVNEPIDQGDIIDQCPLLNLVKPPVEAADTPEIDFAPHRVVVLTQTCDLANQKITHTVVALVHEAQILVERGLLSVSEIRGNVRATRSYGWYFLPKSPDLGFPESIVDLRRLHSVRLDFLRTLCLRGQRRARIQPLYREHLAKHFADTYSRIGLPEPYPTD